jgi:hypothetical protein
MAENSNRRDGPENRSAADADATSDATDEEFGRSERGTGSSQGTRADTTGSTLTDAEGKTVVDHEGNTVGLVDEIEGETLYIEPDPGITDRISAPLGRAGRDDGDWRIETDRIDTVTATRSSSSTPRTSIRAATPPPTPT